MITTDATEMLGIEQPIVLAPMCGMATGELAGAVARAGGLGLIGVGANMLFEPAWVRDQFTTAKTHAQSDARGAIGFGFITCFLTPNDPTLEASLALEPDVIFLAYGDNVAPYVEMAHAAQAKVICQVHTVSQAVRATEAGADIITVQGCDAGGHGQQHLSTSITTLVPQVRDAISSHIPLLAAGGIVDGRGLAAALVLGAGGAVIGSRFVVADESKAPDGFKARIVETGSQDAGTIVSSSFDLLSGIDWPAEFRQGRALADSEAVKRFHRPIGAEQVNPSQREKDWYKSSGYQTRAVWVNNAVGLVETGASAEVITSEIVAHARKILDRF